MRIALLTDAWLPQTSGVVTTLTRMVDGLTARGHELLVVHPDLFRTVPCPTYPGVRLAVLPGRPLARMVDDFAPDAIHVPVEGPIGIAGRNYCVKRGLPFTTTFTTKFAEYVEVRTGVPASVTYRAMRWFHGPSVRTMVATESLEAELKARGFGPFARWERGVDTELFRPCGKEYYDLPRPVHAVLGRVAPEKNLKAFLDLDLPGSKVVIGGGPALDGLRAAYPKVHFTGWLVREELPKALSAADVFVFPSLTDTFGIVLLEAMACGLPVAAYPVVGPKDVIVHGETGWLDEDLAVAVEKARSLDPEACRAHASRYTWTRCLDQFETALAPIDRNALRKAG